jgi:hypothetical protein
MEELPVVQPAIEATNETEPVNTTAAAAPAARSSAASSCYSLIATVFAVAVSAMLAV